MYSILDKVMYHNEVCIIKDIQENKYNHLESYVLMPCDDMTLTIEIPVTSKDVLRPLIDKN